MKKMIDWIVLGLPFVWTIFLWLRFSEVIPFYLIPDWMEESAVGLVFLISPLCVLWGLGYSYYRKYWKWFAGYFLFGAAPVLFALALMFRASMSL